MPAISRSRVLLATVVSALALGTSACSSGEPAEAESASTEVTGPRLAVTHDEGVLVLERDTLKPVADLETTGFVRVNPAGDSRHLFVSTADGFRLLDTGVEEEAHGDHSHFRAEAEPTLGDTFEAPEPGHVTVHDGRTLLFSDGAGTVQTLDSEDPTEVVDTWTAPDPHHGVAVSHGDGMVVTEGTADGRSSALLLDADGREVARTDDCPGVHGEATAKDGAVLLGCEDGVVVLDGDSFTKIDAPDAYGRIGNQAGSASSPIVLGDYKTDADAELERPETIALVDTEKKSLRTVDLGTSYSFRSLGRGAAGEAVVLGTDGALHVIDARDGKRLDTIDVVDPWREPLDWQKPRPTLLVDGDTAWVSDPAAKRLHEVDLAAGAVVDTVTFPVVPNELTTTTSS